MTQEELAEAIGLSHRQYQRFEKGNATLKAKHLEAVARVLKCEVHELFGGNVITASHGSLAKKEMAQNFAFVSKLLNAPLDYHYLVEGMLNGDGELLEKMSKPFVRKLQHILSTL